MGHGAFVICPLSLVISHLLFSPCLPCSFIPHSPLPTPHSPLPFTFPELAKNPLLGHLLIKFCK
ncbi:hypothetical protein [Nostoc sp. CHAB 5715]|uniref:hypothetical protein n=1 Tax=Nostoc sp. CHAB 5715 TaxID=2780400 RepID=UPI001E43BEAF|nr:hypothetical protein [Nostoc sp. CHAB 5715]MCC5619789.1 hypothetical protein [Nostoc sp. CHAB 5715]